MNTDIKTCFESYVNYMKANHLKKLDPNYLSEISSMTNSQIGSQLNILHMQYILSSAFTITKTSPAYVAFTHLRQMIDREIISDPNQDIKPRGWFFNK